MEETSIQGALQTLLERAFEAAPEFWPAFAAWWQTMRREGGMDPGLAILITLLVIGIVYGIERLGVYLIERHRQSKADPEAPAKEGQVHWALSRVLSLVFFMVLCNLLIAILSKEGSTLDWISGILFAVALRFRVFLSLLELLGRQVELTSDGADAERKLSSELIKRVRIPLATASVLYVVRSIVVQAIGPEDSLLAVGIVLTAALMAATAWVFISLRKPGAELIRRIFSERREPGTVVTFAMRYWYVFYAAFLILSDLMTFGREMGLSAGVQEEKPAIGVLLLLIPSLLIANRTWLKHKMQIIEGRAAGWYVGISSLIEGILLIAAASFVLDAWGIWSPRTAEESELEQFIGRGLFAVITLVVGLSIWRALAAVLDLHAPDEEDRPETYGEPGRAVSSRYATIYPVIRAFALVSVYAVTIMIALSSMGVEIGPLIAGAGVVGLAIGFGAQTLVKDIISGILYLQEDAFRIGEYIVTKEGKGTVEKISLRSARLRHHRGAVFTIPFGDMGTIQNHSRDWTKIKFTIEISADEDLERIRKLIKKVGLELLEDPEIGEHFLEPLKSQGAVGMNGPNYIIGIKFSCKPGEQFMIRRKAYVAMQKAIRDHDIQGVTPKIVVETTSPNDPAVGAAGAV